ncbi:hypothetical protein Vadar_019746 [Vaccinium darrowii]|uniref:Uncharacterized protein n=1 Tax=Vaccinium darrowii TaxID=229202 RepID=A0ACB7X229_9ERIC|nr:hypothetical protein Vadar_019746 [Vaccinium darrowii]
MFGVHLLRKKENPNFLLLFIPSLPDSTISCSMERNQRSISDVISNLPSNVTENILKDLPLREAVRTSVLSSKWRYKWVTLPHLVFDGEFFYLPKVLDKEKLKAVIYQVLLHHKGPLMKFTLWYPPFESCLDINNWISILLTKNVQEFSFALEISVTLVSLGTRDKELEEADSDWVKFFPSLPAIEKMNLHGAFLESFAADNIPERLPSTLNQLKVLVLSDVCYSYLDHLSWAFCLLRSSPNLHKLQSSILYINPIQDPAMEFLQAQDFSNFSLNQLREVEIRHFTGTSYEGAFGEIYLSAIYEMVYGFGVYTRSELKFLGCLVRSELPFPDSTVNQSMKGNQRSTSDIISNLPSNVTENILKDLPLREAVRTSVLSSKWRYRWVSLPHLVFNCEFFYFPKVMDKEKLKAIIYQVLLHHQGPLMKFALLYPPFESCLDINNWISILLTKNIQEFSFALGGGLYHEIPRDIYSLLQLRELKLSKCVFNPPSTFKGFSRLVNLNFFRVNISSERCALFISNCPLLRRLRLNHCSDFDSLEINAPNLNFFDFSGIFASVSLENTPLLAEISVTLLSWDTMVKGFEEADSEWVKFFPSLPAIEVMNLDSSFLESFAANNVPERLPSTLNQLKVLVLSDVCYSNLDHVSWALCLLRSSPNLRKLRSSILNLSPVQDHVTEFLQAQDFSKFSMNQLREVEIRRFSGAEPEILFVKMLLAHSKVLEKMVILHEQEISGEKGFAMSKELI